MLGDLPVAAHEAHFAVRILEAVRGHLDDVPAMASSHQRVDEHRLQGGLFLLLRAEQEDPVEVPQDLRRRRIVEGGHHVLRLPGRSAALASTRTIAVASACASASDSIRRKPTRPVGPVTRIMSLSP